MKTFRLSVCVLCVLIFSGFLSSASNMKISTSVEKEHQEMLWNGITKIEINGGTLYLKPMNNVWESSISRVLYFIKFQGPVADKKYNFLDLQLYPEAEGHNKANSFAFELLVDLKGDLILFTPQDCFLKISNKTLNTNRYFTVKLLRFYKPGPYGHGDLFRGQEVKSALRFPREEKKLLLHESTGFILYFDYPAPIPGEETFSFGLDGIESENKKIPAVTVDYVGSKINEIPDI